MDYVDICKNEYSAFHQLLSAYYRDGEDSTTPQAEIDAFVQYLFEKVLAQDVAGCLVKDDEAYVGFALWGVDTEEFPFHEICGYGVILEIGFLPDYRAKGNGQKLVSHIEENLRKRDVSSCYVSAYGPAKAFWRSCGYAENGQKAQNGLPIMTKSILQK